MKRTKRIVAIPLKDLRGKGPCADCIWLEWDDKKENCANRDKFVCWQYVREVFGNGD